MVLVPYPHAGGHQRFNASAVVAAGAALCIEDDACEPSKFAEVVLPLMGDSQQLHRMGVASRACGHPAAAENLASRLLDYAGVAK
jgi:UDP-N-acetylglucosamine--N-acetylmuramyl-(pentapeptide) pyrophosphoryl-undecaprenol N-acetylglucosamine transferase